MIEKSQRQSLIRQHAACPFPIAVNRFDGNTPNRFSTSQRMQSDAPGTDFQAAKVFEMNQSTSTTVGNIKGGNRETELVGDIPLG